MGHPCTGDVNAMGKMTSLYWIRALVLGEIHMYISDYTAPILFVNIYNQHDSFISSHLFIGAHCQHFPIKQHVTIFINLISFLFTSTGLHSYKLKTIILMTMMPVMTIQLLVYACFRQLLTFYKKKDTIVVDLASSGGNGVYLRFFSYHTFSFSWQQSCNVLSFSDASIFSCDQAALQMVFSVCLSVRLSVCPSVRLSVTPFWLCSHHRIIMKFSGVITNDQRKVHAKGQGQRSKVKVTEVTTQLNRFRTVTPVWIHIWWWNDAYSLMLLRRGALLFFKVIRQISRSHGSKNRRIWPRLGVSGL